MLPLTIEAKLLTIVFLTLMNLLLLKRKKNNSDTVESYMIQGEQPHNVNSNDSKQNNDSFSVKYEYTEKFVDLGNDIESVFNHNGKENNLLKQQAEHLLFVRLDNNSKQIQNSKKEQTDPRQPYLQSMAQNLPQPTAPLSQKTQNITNALNTAQSASQQPKPIVTSIPQIIIPPLCIPMQEEKPVPSQQQQFHDIAYEIKSDHGNSNSRSSKIVQDIKPIIISSTERKFVEKKFPYELESQQQSDSHTRRTEINPRGKEKSSCKNHCQCCKNSLAPRQTLKRCLQDLIYSTFEQMIEKDTLQENFGHKKKKRSL